jgi:hypothetical protein
VAISAREIWRARKTANKAKILCENVVETSELLLKKENLYYNSLYKFVREKPTKKRC